MAVGVLGVLTVAGTTVMVYTTSNTRISARSKSDENSFSLSEAALNNAMAVLSNPSNNALDSDLLPSTEATASSATYENGTAKWYGTLDRSAAVWTITALGVYNNPAGGAQIKRKLTAQVPVTPTLTQPLNNPSWNYVMSTQVTGGQCDMWLANGTNTGEQLTVSARLYVFGNLCLGTASGGKADIAGGPLMVLGKATILEGSSSIGTSTTAINEAHIKNGCQYLSQSLHKPCVTGAGGTGTKDNIWATVNDANPTVLTAPTIDMAGWYENAIPGPAQSCTTSSGTPPTFDGNYPTRNNSVGVMDLTPVSSYKCRVGPGAETTTTGAMTASQTTVSVASATGFPTTAFRVRIDDELMNVTAGFGGTTWTVSRGVNGTTAAAHVTAQTIQWDTPPSGAIIWNATTKKLTVNGTIFIDGSAKIANGALNIYKGWGAIYLSGTFYMSSGTKMCAWTTSGGTCSNGFWSLFAFFVIATNGVGPNQGGLVPAGDGTKLAGSIFQGWLYSTNNIESDAAATIMGPAIANQLIIGSNVAKWNSFGNTGPSGAPGNSPSNSTTQDPSNFTG
ncbi:MAG: hypothetical protein QOC92_648 [Acidimicrobiaceae bacterium]